MRKLRKAEQRFLEAIPAREHMPESLQHVMWAHERPRGTNRATVTNLYELGLIEHGPFDLCLCPVKLTEAGKRALLENGGSDE